MAVELREWFAVTRSTFLWFHSHDNIKHKKRAVSPKVWHVIDWNTTWLPKNPMTENKERILDSLSLNGYWIQHRIGKAIIIDIKHWMDNVKKQRQESQEKKDKTWERKAWKDRETIDYWPEDGERILKVTKKSGNRGRCRKLCLWKWLLNSLTIQ